MPPPPFSFACIIAALKKDAAPVGTASFFRQSAKNSNNKLYCLPKIMPICEILLPKIYGGGGIIYLEFPQGAGAK